MPKSNRTAQDERWMKRALELARQGLGYVEPNPMVGCLIVRDDQVIGQGFHQRFGEAHAEVMALNSIASTSDARGATAYVTLEPCCHYGKTPPCTKALIEAGIARVVVAMSDPYAQVDGGGLRQLADAGIATTSGVLKDQAQELNAPYLKRIKTGMPWVIAKWAMTLDGRIATVGGQSRWITGPKSRHHVHHLRGRVDAVMVGMGTVVADDPMLTVRLETDPPRIPTRVVFCRRRVPSMQSNLIKSVDQAPLMLVVSSDIDADQKLQLAKTGATLVDTQTADPTEMVDAALRHMGKMDMTNVMIEGGSQLLASFLAADQIDECHVFLGAKVFGGTMAPGPIGGRGIERIADATSWRLQKIDRFDDDLRAIYRRHR